MKNILAGRWQKIVLVCAILLAAGFIVYMFFGDYLPGSSYWQQKKLLSDLERPYRTDTYGGKTPEETFDMFLSALKSGDVELASRYLGPEDKERWLKWFNGRTQEEKAQYVKELSEAPSKWEKEMSDESVSFLYKTHRSQMIINIQDGTGKTIKKVFPAGEYGSIISIYFNTYTKIWKISEI